MIKVLMATISSLPIFTWLQWQARDDIDSFITEYGIDSTCYGKSVLSFAVTNGEADEVAKILAYNPDLYAIGEYGQTPLEDAIRHGDPIKVKLLFMESTSPTTMIVKSIWLIWPSIP